MFKLLKYLLRLLGLGPLATIGLAAPVQTLPPSPYELLLRPLPALQNLSRYLPPAGACAAPTTPLLKALAQATAPAGGEQACGNAVGPLVYFPSQDFPLPEGQVQPASAHGGFDVLAQQIRGAQQEVLLANMFWEDGPQYPGRVLAQAIADLRAQVRDHPEQYPRGVVVRVLLGNAVWQEGQSLDPLNSLVELLKSLLAVGVPLPGQPETVQGFHLEVGNWPYLHPHSHVKLLVIDGKSTVIGGYNITPQHLPPETDLQRSKNTHDLALTVSGPLARQSAAVFDDMWQQSRRVSCQKNTNKGAIEYYCPPEGQYNTAETSHTWLHDPLPTGQDWAFPIYRRNGFYNGDEAFVSLLGSAEKTLDLTQAQVSGKWNCTVTLGAKDGCIFPQDALPMWQVVIKAIEQRHVQVRILLDYTPDFTMMESYAFIHAMQTYLKSKGLQDYFAVRLFADGRQHTKAITVDNQVFVVGSYNLHYSSAGVNGLNEYAVATNNKAALAQYQTQFEYYWQRAKPIKLPWWLQ